MYWVTPHRCFVGTRDSACSNHIFPNNLLCPCVPHPPRHSDWKPAPLPLSSLHPFQLPITVYLFHRDSHVCALILSPLTLPYFRPTALTGWTQEPSACFPASRLSHPCTASTLSHSAVLKHSSGHGACVLKSLAYWVNSGRAKTWGMFLF